MRRKSTRNSQKSSPEKAPKEVELPPKTRRSKRRKRTPSKSSDSEDEVITLTRRTPLEETPDTTTKSHSPSDDEASGPMWKVTSSDDTPKGEIKKLKICLTRPTPDSPEKGGRSSRRSKSNSQTEDDATSSEDKSSARQTRSRGSPFIQNDGLSSQEEEAEGKKGKGKSKGKHKSKIEQSPQIITEPEIPNQLSENVQVTPQSPSIDKPVHNENDSNKVDDVSGLQNTEQKINQEGNFVAEESLNKNLNNDVDEKSDDIKPTANDSDDDEPLITIKKTVINESQSAQAENKVQESFPDHKDAQESLPDQDTVQEATSKEFEDANNQKLTDISEEQTETNVNNLNKQEQEAVLPIETEGIDKKDVPPVETEVFQTEAVLEKEQEQPMDVDEPEDFTKQSNTEIEAPVFHHENNLQRHEANQEEVDTAEKPELLIQEKYPVEDETKSKSDTDAIPVKAVDSKEKKTKLVEVEGKKRSPIRLRRDLPPPREDDPTAQQKINVQWVLSDLSPPIDNINLETLQALFPSIEFPLEPDLNLIKERRKSEREPERKVSVDFRSDDETVDQEGPKPGEDSKEDKSNIIAFNRKISIVDDTASKLKPPPSPAKNPKSCVLFISNLVRPFTLKHLKELMERTGKIREDGFWTDRIKSKCYVHYETEEEAEATRNALHGVQWPIGNGKKLVIEFSTVDDFEKARNPAPPPVIPSDPIPEVTTVVKENVDPHEIKEKEEEANNHREVKKRRDEGPVREWDIGKKDSNRERSKSRNRDRDKGRKHKRSPSPTEDFISRKQRKTEENVPQKLMDDLFLKTKTTPSIYWQPLSPEEISMKQQQRLIRMEEHKRRMEENFKLRGRDGGGGGGGRGTFRRRYN